MPDSPNENQPLPTTSPQTILARLEAILAARPLAVCLIGGCSRAGKSSLVRHLLAAGLPGLHFQMDAWIVGAAQRPAGATVFQRFETGRIEEALAELLAGGIVYPPVYDPISRQRVAAYSDTGCSLSRGVVLVDGVLALALPKMRAQADLKVFVAVAEATRRARLLDFYVGAKGFSLPEAAALIDEREKEEVATVKASAHFADLIYRSAGDSSPP